jgi:CBS domain-containing protein
MTRTKGLDALARDLMKKDVLRVEESTPLAQAVEFLEDAGIGGVPVVDAAERLIGVFSLRDAARAGVAEGSGLGERAKDDRLLDRGDEPLEEGEPIEDAISDRDDYSSATSGTQTVREWMNPAVICVAPQASLKEVCRVMARERIHRVFVVEDKRLTGVISTLDVVEYLAHAL